MGEKARHPDAPDFPKTPADLLEPLPGEGYSLLYRYSFPAAGVISGVGSIVLANAAQKRPVWAGIYLHFLLGTCGYLLGTIWTNYKIAARSEDDAVLKHYICLHPDDFPPFERKRIKELFLPWTPIR